MKMESSTPFNSKKAKRYDSKEDALKLSKNFYFSAIDYRKAVSIIMRQDLQLAPIGIAFEAFACELFLKSLLYRDSKESGQKHSLLELYKMLDADIQILIKSRISSNYNDDFDLCLAESSTNFVDFRYIAENRSIVGNFDFLQCFSQNLEQICVEKGIPNIKG